MSQIFTADGSKVFISNAPVAPKPNATLADFASVTWVQIDGLYELGELGGEQTINTFELLDSEWAVKAKGSRDGGTMSNVFIPDANDPGQIKFKEAIENCRPYAFKVERGSQCIPESTVTISVAGPAVISWPAHGLSVGQPIVFSNEGGALPTGLTAGTVYYIISTGLTADAFSVSTTKGGAAVATTGAGTGVNTASAPIEGMTDMFQGLATDGTKSGGGKNDAFTQTWPIAVNGRVVTV